MKYFFLGFTFIIVALTIILLVTNNNNFVFATIISAIFVCTSAILFEIDNLK